jgi:glycerol transport system ATP-binding protein
VKDGRVENAPRAGAGRVELDAVGKTVGADVHLHPVSLALEPGDLAVVLGATLAGKTTLLRVLAGLDRPSTGQIRVGGRDVTGLHVRERSVAMVYQQFINYPTLTVYENIASPLRVAGAPRAEIESKVKEAAALLKLEAHLTKTPLQLSGGQQQRTAMARALVKGADLVLMDEPLANLDYKLREELREELPKIFARRGAILVYATTEPAEALMLGGKVLLLHEGRLVQHGRASEVYRAPHDLLSAQVFSDPPLNTMTVTKRGGEITLATGEPHGAHGAFAGLADGDYTLGIRAHHLALRRPAGEAMKLIGRVQVSEITGSESYVHVDYGVARFVALAPGVHDITPGSPIETFIDPARVFVFDAAGRLAAAPALAAAA